MFRENFLYQLVPVASFVPWKTLAPSALYFLFWYSYILIKSLRAFFRQSSPSSLSLSSQKREEKLRISHPFIIFVAPCWAVSSNSMSPLYWGAQHWALHSRCGLSRAEWRDRIPSCDLTVLCPMQPRITSGFLAERAHCWLMFSLLATSIPKPFSPKLLPSCLCPSLCWYLGLSLPRCILGTSSCWTSWGSCWPVSPACQGSCGWQKDQRFMSHFSQFGVTCKPESTLCFTIQIINGNVKKVHPAAVLWVTPLVICLQLDFLPLVTTLWVQPEQFRQFSIHLTVCRSRQCWKSYWSLDRQHPMLCVPPKRPLISS